ncbi:conserved hypothetical protein [Candidatus Desulfarcum epimagneticum]|uniref:AAA+ ATPase domain-containing protein n=1 Tax=uncultured Desulfobacteraceae bacterium TaxID=218296 RepID=A0A484HFY4_9BACT|nr:conserved hypothetical protein [uncultured Desulfobacteraceae bacterium]
MDEKLKYLKLAFMRQNYEPLARHAENEKWSHTHYLEELVTGEANLKRDRSTQRRIRMARFPQIKTLEQFKWTWPKKINKAHVQSLFHLKFIEQKANVIFLGGVGLGKTHLAAALGYAACLKSHSVLFATAISVINNLSAAKNTGRLKEELKKYCKPKLLILDELGYLPVDHAGAKLLFQIISERYETSSTIITTNKAFKDWSEIFNNDSTLASAILDRLLHHAETILIEGQSFRMKDKIET